MTRRRGSERQTSFAFEMERGKHAPKGGGKTCSVVGDVKVCSSDAAIYATYEMEKYPDKVAKVTAYRSSQGRGEQCRFETGGAKVPYPLIDKGIGTKLYEAVAKKAGDLGCSLRSDSLRSVFSEAFWRKQQRKGRAMCGSHGRGDYYSTPLNALKRDCEDAKFYPDRVKDGTFPDADTCKRLLDPARLPKPNKGGNYGTWPCGFWVLNFPPPYSLGRVKRRRK